MIAMDSISLRRTIAAKGIEANCDIKMQYSFWSLGLRC